MVRSFRELIEDFRRIPDAAMTIAAIAPMCEGPTTLRGIASWRVKKTDRIEAMAKELKRWDVKITSAPDWLRIVPLKNCRALHLIRIKDHRMAMCMSFDCSRRC